MQKIYDLCKLGHEVKRYYLFNLTDKWNADDISTVQDLKFGKNEGYFKTAIVKGEKLTRLFGEDEDVFGSDADDYILAYTTLAEEIIGLLI